MNKKNFEEKFPFLKNYQFDVVILMENLTKEFFEDKTVTSKQYPEYSIVHDDFKDTQHVRLKDFLEINSKDVG